MSSASSRSSCQGDCSSVTTYFNGMSRYSRAIVRSCGTVTPRKRSHAPYSPGPVLKNHLLLSARSRRATFLRSRRTDANAAPIAPTAPSHLLHPPHLLHLLHPPHLL